MSTAPHYEIDVERFWRDPYPDLAAMRAQAPIAFVPQLGATLITTRDDIAVCEKNVAVFSSDQPGGLMNVLMGKNMMRRDGADHQAQRRLYSPAMSPNVVRQVWAAQFESHAAHILDGMVELRRSDGADRSGVVDLVTAYAMPVSGEGLKSMTGLTNITWADMDGWSQAMIDGMTSPARTPMVRRTRAFRRYQNTIGRLRSVSSTAWASAHSATNSRSVLAYAREIGIRKRTTTMTAA